MSNDSRARWFARMVEAGITSGVISASDLVAHATPELMAEHLPPDLLAKLLTSSLQSGQLTPDFVLAQLPAETLATHLPHDALWNCLRTGLSETEAGQPFLLASLQAARDEGFLGAPDILRHITPDIMAAHLPRAVWAKLLGALVSSGKADADAVMGAIDLETIVTHVPPSTTTALLLDIGSAALGDNAGAPVVPAWGATASAKAGPNESTVSASFAANLRNAPATDAPMPAARNNAVASRPSAQWSRVGAPTAVAAPSLNPPSVVGGRRPQSAATVRAKPPTIEPKFIPAEAELDLGEERLDAEELVDWAPTSEATVNIDEKRRR